ncbi:ER membrane protein SH3-domain-containing protein [Chiua virens]|nr:ER membrane protein SH3-domain-containing protein [Chiua virens]
MHDTVVTRGVIHMLLRGLPNFVSGHNGRPPSRMDSSFTLRSLMHLPLSRSVHHEPYLLCSPLTRLPQALLHGFIGVGLTALVAKLHRWDESAVFFDGSSLAAYLFAISVYVAVTIPCLRTIVTPAEEDSMNDRIEAMRILSAGNTIMILILGAILGLQGGQEYARRLEQGELAKLEKKEKKEVARSTSEKDKKE